MDDRRNMVIPSITKITTTQCPVCDAPIDSVKIWSLHTCGHWNEDVGFKCGFHLHYSPNYSRVVHEGTCSNATDVALKLKLR